MVREYANKQPQGFKNYIEKIAIVGVSCEPISRLTYYALTLITGRWSSRQIHRR